MRDCLPSCEKARNVERDSPLFVIRFCASPIYQREGKVLLQNCHNQIDTESGGCPRRRTRDTVATMPEVQFVSLPDHQLTEDRIDGLPDIEPMGGQPPGIEDL